MPEDENVVLFIAPKIDLNETLKKLKEYANEKKVQIVTEHTLKILQVFSISLSKEDAEKLFDVKLEWTTFTVNNLNRGPYQGGDWKVIKPPSVPKELEDVIR